MYGPTIIDSLSGLAHSTSYVSLSFEMLLAINFRHLGSRERLRSILPMLICKAHALRGADMLGTQTPTRPIL